MAKRKKKRSNGQPQQFEDGLMTALDTEQDSHAIVEQFLPVLIGKQPNRKPDELRVLLHAYVEQRRTGSMVAFEELLNSPPFAPGDMMQPPPAAQGDEIEVHTNAIVEESMAQVNSEPPPIPPHTPMMPALDESNQLEAQAPNGDAVESASGFEPSEVPERVTSLTTEQVTSAPPAVEAVVSSVEIALQFTPAPCTPAPSEPAPEEPIVTPALPAIPADSEGVTNSESTPASEAAPESLAHAGSIKGLESLLDSAPQSTSPDEIDTLRERELASFEATTDPISQRARTRIMLQVEIVQRLESYRMDCQTIEEGVMSEAQALYASAKSEALPELALEILEIVPSLMRKNGQDLLTYLVADERYALAKRLLTHSGWQVVNAEFDRFARLLLGEDNPESLVAVFSLMAKGGLSVKFMTTLANDLRIGRNLREAADQFLHPTHVGWQYAMRFGGHSEFMIHVGRTTEDHQEGLNEAEKALRKSVLGEASPPTFFDRFLSWFGLTRAT